MPDLTDADYDALVAAMQADRQRMWREIFRKITVTDAEVAVSSAKAPKTAVYRAKRKRRLY